MIMEHYDCLLIHVPNLSNFYLPLGSFVNTNMIPSGLLALAELLNRQGFRSQVIHMGIERLRDPGYSLVDFLKNNRVRAVGLSLLWFHQSYDVIDLARKIKRALPNMFVFLGGLTASIFAGEIVEKFPFIDAVARGYGEAPLLALAAQSRAGKIDLAAVPNLVYRDSSAGVVCSERMCGTDEKIFSQLVYGDLSVVRNHELYVRYFGLHEMPLHANEDKLREIGEFTKMFHLAVGRGCDAQCSYCGGSRQVWRAFEGNANKKYLYWRDIPAVVRDLKRVMGYGYRKVFINFDPPGLPPGYYPGLFKRIREERLEVSMYFECWNLPSRALVEAFARTFPDDLSHMLLSVDSASMTLRARHRGHTYTGKDLFDCLEMLDHHKVRFDICLSAGLPGSSMEEALETRTMLREMVKKFKYSGRVMTFLIELVPGSPMFNEPGKFALEIDRKNFMDYYNAFAGARHPTHASCNYKIGGYFGDERDQGNIEEFGAAMRQLLCMEFCFMGNAAGGVFSPPRGRCACLEERKKIMKEFGESVSPRIIDGDFTYGDALREFEAVCPARDRAAYD
jgi:hypothetical protein